MEQYPDIEEIIENCHIYCGACQSYGNDLILGFTLSEPVDIDVLKKAVKLTLPRYPYLSVRIELKDEMFRLRRNDGDVPIGDKLPSCWGPETNDHLWFVFIDGKDIEFHCFHGLCDGGGLMPFCRTTVCRYLMLKYPEILGPETIDSFQNGNECTEDEWCRPFPDKKFEDAKECVSFPPDTVFSLSGEPFADGEVTMNKLMVDESEFMRYVKSVKGTPNLVTAMMMNNVVKKYRSDDKKIVVGIPAQLKKFVGLPNTHHNILPLLSIEVPTEMSENDMMVDMRAKMKDAFSDERMKGYVNGILTLTDMLMEKKTIDEKKGLARYIIASNINAVTFHVSYMRAEDLGVLAPFIERMQNHIDGRGIHWMMEMVANGKYLTFNSLQGMDDKGLFEGFCAEFDRMGIKYEIVEKRPARYIGWNY